MQESGLRSQGGSAEQQSAEKPEPTPQETLAG